MKTVLHINGEAVTLEAVERKTHEVAFTMNGRQYRFRSQKSDAGFVLEEETAPDIWKRSKGTAWADGKGGRIIQLGALEAKISAAQAGQGAVSTVAALSPLSPMPGLVRQILVKKGDKVKEGDKVAVMEAMKLQMALFAGGNAVVEAVLVKEGEMIAEGVELVRLKAV